MVGSVGTSALLQIRAGFNLVRQGMVRFRGAHNRRAAGEDQPDKQASQETLNSSRQGAQACPIEFHNEVASLIRGKRKLPFAKA